MKKATKTVEMTTRDAQTISDPTQGCKPVSLQQVREEIVQLVSEHARDMVLHTIEEANNGHYAAMKFLFEMTGLYPAASEEESQDDNGLAKLLLEQLGITPEPEGDAAAEPPPLPAIGSTMP